MTKSKTDVLIMDDTLMTSQAGVYMLMFSNGQFYIGSSRCLRTRIMEHLRHLTSDISNHGSCKALRLMSGFKGYVSLYLVELVDVSGLSTIEKHRELLKHEAIHLIANANEKKCLNWNRKSSKYQISVKCS